MALVTSVISSTLSGKGIVTTIERSAYSTVFAISSGFGAGSGFAGGLVREETNFCAEVNCTANRLGP